MPWLLRLNRARQITRQALRGACLNANHGVCREAIALATAGTAKATCPATTLDKFINDLKLHLLNRHDHELR